MSWSMLQLRLSRPRSSRMQVQALGERQPGELGEYVPHAKYPPSCELRVPVLEQFALFPTKSL